MFEMRQLCCTNLYYKSLWQLFLYSMRVLLIFSPQILKLSWHNWWLS